MANAAKRLQLAKELASKRPTLASQHVTMCRLRRSTKKSTWLPSDYDYAIRMAIRQSKSKNLKCARSLVVAATRHAIFGMHFEGRPTTALPTLHVGQPCIISPRQRRHVALADCRLSCCCCPSYSTTLWRVERPETSHLPTYSRYKVQGASDDTDINTNNALRKADCEATDIFMEALQHWKRVRSTLEHGQTEAEIGNEERRSLPKISTK